MAEPIKLDDAGNTGSSPSQVKINLGAPAVDLSAPSKENGGGMGNIFTQTQAKKEDSKMITSIISQKEVAQKTKSILGPAPTLEKSIEQEREATAKRKMRLFQFVFVALFVSSVAMAFYFYTQLSPDFSYLGANVTQSLTLTNSNLLAAQAKVNQNRYLEAQLKLNEFSYEADRFLSSVQKTVDPNINSVDKQAFFASVDESKQALPLLLTDIRDTITKDIVVQTYVSDGQPEQTDAEVLSAAQTALRGGLNDQKKAYGQNPTSPQDIADVKLIDNASKLVGNTALLNVLQKTSVSDFKKQLDDYASAPDDTKLQNLQAVISKVLASTKSDLATIANIKQKRVDWSTIITQINTVTTSVDSKFGKTPSLYDSLGGIVYTGYEFDSNSNKIVLSGMTKTFDGSNFTVLSQLIDKLESSDYFQNVDMRSFSKSKSGDDGSSDYIANFKIDLRLQTQSTTNPQSTTTLQNNVVTPATGTKRTDTSAVAPATEETSTLSPAAPTDVSTSAAAPAPSPTSAAPIVAPTTQETVTTGSTSQESTSTVAPDNSASASAPAATTAPVQATQESSSTSQQTSTSTDSGAPSILNSLFSSN